MVALWATMTASATNNLTKKLQDTRTNPIASFHKQTTSGLMTFGRAEANGPRRISDFEKKGEIKDAELFGTINGEDGSVWFYTMTTTESATIPYAYGSATINLYDSSNALVTTVTCEVPEGMRVNYIEPFGGITSKFYDTDSKTKEFAVYLHEVGEDYSSIGHFFIYNTNGELVSQYDDLGNIIFFDASVKYDTYQRAFFVNGGQDAEGNATTRISVMKPASWSAKEPTEEHVFEVRDDLIEYSNGPCFNAYNIGGKPYYMLSYYEKPFTQGWDENYEIILTENNNYVVEIYDKEYNQVTTFKVPVTHPEEAYCSEYTCGLYSYEDLNRGYFSGDDNLNVIITRIDVRLDTDDDTYPYAFLAYNQDGTLINTIAENVITWKQMTDICGEGDQVGCICLNDGTETLDIINLPSCQKAITFEANTAGRKISSNYDRYPVGDSFQYVIGMGDAETDTQGNVIAAIGWFKQDGSLDHFTKFNLGVNGEYFTPLIEGYALNPALVNTDSAHEYIYIAKERRNDGSGTIENVLIIADEEGNEIQRYSGGADKTLRVASVLDTEIGKPRLVVGFTDNELDSYDIDFYSLPFVKFSAGGDGSAENPYVITSPGDLAQMGAEPNAHYILGNNIDMNEIAEPWTPISQFGGTLDGQGNAIENLYIDTEDSYAGLVGYLVNDGSFVKNIHFTNPTVVVNSGNRYVGVVAGMTMKTVIDSVFVYNLTAFGEGNAEFGGIAGQATYYTTLASNFVKDADINLPNCSTVGGIVGDTRTATSVDACLFSGELTAQSTVGGIVGTTGKDCAVRNCHVNADITAKNTVGGLIGSAGRNEVSHNFVEGAVTATEADMYGNACAGGVTGSLESLWQGTPSVIISGNVVALTAINAPEGSVAAHRIVGFTIADEQYEEGEAHKTEQGLADNYAINTLAAQGEKGATLPDGADVVTINKDFLESIGFQYGFDAATPWTGLTYPTLYIEDTEAPTGIEEVSGSKFQVSGVKFIQNGRVVIVKNGKRFNTAGQEIK